MVVMAFPAGSDRPGSSSVCAHPSFSLRDVRDGLSIAKPMPAAQSESLLEKCGFLQAKVTAAARLSGTGGQELGSL